MADIEINVRIGSIDLSKVQAEINEILAQIAQTGLRRANIPPLSVSISQSGLRRILKKANAKAEMVYTEKARDAGIKFREVLIEEIDKCAGEDVRDGELGPTAVSFLKQIRRNAPRRLSKTESFNKFMITLNFYGDKHRESLYPEDDRPYTNPYPEGLDNIVAVLNNGYSAKNFVYGKWYGVRQKSLDQRAGAHFLQSARDIFMYLYANEYGVTSIKLDDVYER